MKIIQVLFACLFLASCGGKAEHKSVQDVAVRTQEGGRTRYVFDGVLVSGDFSVADFERIRSAVVFRLEPFETIKVVEVNGDCKSPGGRLAIVVTEYGRRSRTESGSFNLGDTRTIVLVERENEWVISDRHFYGVFELKVP